MRLFEEALIKIAAGRVLNSALKIPLNSRELGQQKEKGAKQEQRQNSKGIAAVWW